MSTTGITKPDLSELTARQRRAWAAGDYSMVASPINTASKRPREDADLRARWRERAHHSRSRARC
jgi:hypothetical protein